MRIELPRRACSTPVSATDPKPVPSIVRLSGGQVVPYPQPSSKAATAIAKSNRRTGTGPEVRLRSALHATGLRFRKDLLIRTAELRVHVDVAFTRQRLAVFVDGCFWHGCPDHGSTPRSNTGYWVPKLAANLERDSRVDQALRASGWHLLRLWEHVPTAEAVVLVQAALEQAKQR